MLRRSLLVSVLGIAAAVAGCGGGGGGNDRPKALATTASGTVILFTLAAPNDVIVTRPLSGFMPGDSVAGLDQRPADGVVYVLGKLGNLYTLNQDTGGLFFIAALTADPTDATSPFAGLAGTQFGVDFNPVSDRLRVVSDSGQNLRVNVANGLVTTDADINPVGPVLTGVAYTNSFAGAVATTLYDIDAAAGQLYVQNPPNNGTLTSVATLGVSATTVNGFDILPTGNRGYAALTVGGVTNLYIIDLTLAVNAASLVGTIGAGADPVTGFTLLD